MNEALEKKQHLRITFLKKIYELSNGNTSVSVNGAEVAHQIGIKDGEEDVVSAIAEYLEGDDLIKVEQRLRGFPALVRLTHNGLRKMENAISQNENPTTFDIINKHKVNEMNIQKAKAIQLIEKQISLFQNVLTETTYDNRFNEEYTFAYNGTKHLLTELFSETESKKFQKEVNVHSPITFLDDETDYAKELRDYKEHINRCILQLKIYEETIQNFWKDEDVIIDIPNDQKGKDGAIVKSKKKVFVVHGRNEDARIAMFTFLRSLSLEPIEWAEAISLTKKGTPHIGEILDHAFNNARAVIVLFTGDDIAKLCSSLLKSDDLSYEKEFTPQSRPNVLFEAGMAFGREPDRTILVALGNIRPFSDIAGKNMVKISNKPEDKHKLVSRLKTAGCDFDIEKKSDWLKTGDFDGAIQKYQIQFEEESKFYQNIHNKKQSEVTAIEETPSENIDKIQTEILMSLSSCEKKRSPRVSAESLNTLMTIDLTLLKYNLDELVRKDYILKNIHAEYSLKHKGRAFLVENKFIK